MEAQQDEAAAGGVPQKPALTREEADRLREKESLHLSLQSVAQRLAQSLDPRHRAMLENARADLERRIHELGS